MSVERQKGSRNVLGHQGWKVGGQDSRIAGGRLEGRKAGWQNSRRKVGM